jgi:hypothetical protein
MTPREPIRLGYRNPFDPLPPPKKRPRKELAKEDVAFGFAVGIYLGICALAVIMAFLK